MKKMLFFMVTILALSCLFVTASASEIDDVIFTKGGTEVFTVGAGEIKATVNVSVDAETPAALVTAAYENDRLQSIQWEGITLTPSQKVYEGTAVTANAATTRVDAMVWGLPSYSPIDTKESLTNVSRQISVENISVTDAENTQIHYGYIDENKNRIYIQQSVDFYTSNGYYNAFAEQKKYNLATNYALRPNDYISLQNANFSYKLNGVEKNQVISLSADQPTKLTLSAPNGREKTYDVIVEKYIATYTITLPENGISTTNINKIRINTTDGSQRYGNSRYRSGDGFYAYCIANSTDYAITKIQDTTADTYFNLSYVKGAEIGRATDSSDTALKVIKKGTCYGAWPALEVEETNTHFKKDKYDYSFDFMYTDIDNTTFGNGSLISPTIYSGSRRNYNENAMQLNLMKKTDNSISLCYLSNETGSGMSGYGKEIAVLEKGKWYNIHMIIDKDNTEGEKCMVVVNGKVVLATDYAFKADAEQTTHANGGVFGFLASTNCQGTFYLDNIYTIYSQALPELY